MKFKKTTIASIVAVVISQSAMAQTATVSGTGMGILQNEWVKAGVNTNTGTLGSGGATSPGLLFDPLGTGTFNAGYDYLTPGSPFDGFSLKVDSENKTNNNTGGVGIAKTSGLTLSNSNTTLSWAGAATYAGNSWTVNNAYTLTPTKPYIDITTTIVAGGAASTVYFAKFIDPDSQGMPGDSSSTDNVLGYGAIPSTNVAFSEATVSRYALGLYTAATNSTAGVTGWSSDADAYSGTSYLGGALYGNSDDTIGLSFKWTGVTAGATLTASYAYIFGPSAFSAASSAVTGGAGGGTPGSVPGGGTLVDVGSATAAASAPSAPTVTGTATVNGIPAIADTTGDAVRFSTSVVAGNYLTRNYNSLIVTDTGRVTTTPTTIVTSYSDSSTTSATGAPVIVSENYFNSVDVTHNDVATGSEVIGEIQRVSLGLDAGSLVNARTAPTTVNNGKSITVNAGGVISANELYTVTTPTRFTYDRATTTITANDFAPTSSYTDTSSTVNSTSSVNGEYDVVSADSVGRDAAYDVAVNLRTDQVQTINKLQGIMNRDVEFGKSVILKHYDHTDNGYNGYTNQLGAGATKDIEGGMNLGLGINKLNTALSGNNSSAQAETIQVGATLSKKDISGFDLNATAQHSMTDYTTRSTPSVTINTIGDSRLLSTQLLNRTLPDVTGKTSGTDSSISLRATGPGDVVRPVLGLTYGTRKVDGYTSNIEVLPGTTVSNTLGAVNEDYGYGTIGAVVKYDMFNATALHHTDGVNQIGVGLQKQTDDLTINVRADRLQTKEGGSTVYTAGLVYKF